MKPIDLIPFAEHSQKLPAELLVPVSSSNRINSWKVLTAHMIDFAMVFVLTSFMAAMFSLSIKPIMVTRGLKQIFSDEMVFGASGMILPFMVFNYFFFSYFMNHGQTWGMYILKNRMEMKTQSFLEALKWAAHSAILCFSCGTSFVTQQKVWARFKEHDYLYHNLFTHKESASLNLLAKIDEFESQKVMEEDNWKKVA